jgi:hypothetical protein
MKVTQCRVLITTKWAAEEYNRPICEVLRCPSVCVSEFVRPKYAHSPDGMTRAVRELRECTTASKSRGDASIELNVLTRLNRCTSILKILKCASQLHSSRCLHTKRICPSAWKLKSKGMLLPICRSLVGNDPLLPPKIRPRFGNFDRSFGARLHRMSAAT